MARAAFSKALLLLALTGLAASRQLLAEGDIECPPNSHAHDDHCDCDEGYTKMKLAAASADGFDMECVDADHDGEHHGHGHGHGHGHVKGNMKHINLTLEELAGVWFGEGDQVPQAIYDARGTGEFPNCSAGAGEFNFQHYTVDDPHYRVIAQSPGGAQLLVTNGHLRTRSVAIDGLSGGLLNTTNADGDAVCTHLQPYVDLRSGELKTHTVWKRVWRAGEDGAVAAVSLACEVEGDEEPGCYERGSMEDGTYEVVGVGVQTYVCRGGACLAHSPLYNPEGAAHAY